MLTQEGCLARRKRLWDSLPADVEWILVADPRHVQYLCNFWVQPLSFSGGERGWLCLERSGRTTLLGDNFALRAGVHKPYVDRELIEKWYDHKHAANNRDHALVAALKQLAPELKGRRGLIEAEVLPVAAGDLLNVPAESRNASQEATDGPIYTDLGTAIRAARRSKESDEIELLRQCMRAGEAGVKRAKELIRPGVTELELYRAIADACIAAAGRPGLVYGDFRATNATKPKAGGLPSDYTLQEGDLFILDFSFVLDGYRGDFTNTFAVGKISPALREMHALCMAGMRGGESVLKAGAKASDVHAATFKPYADAGRPELFTHHAGHGIGLAHPEPPILVPDSTDVLQAGDVITLEPGAYQEGIGGMRIEHNYLITPTGYERMTNHVIALD
jgi:Xaa-Pro aminopeptidase